jgi:hypothetical protein
LAKSLTLEAAVSAFGAATKTKLSNSAINGAPEDQLRGPLESLIPALGDLAGIKGGINLVGETTLSQLALRPDYAVSVGKALVGFIEIKAPGKGADPRRFSDPHDRTQWQKLKALPNLLYTDGNSFSLWRNGELQGSVISLTGDVESAGQKLSAPPTLIPLLNDFLTWEPIPPTNAKALADVSARLCRLLRDEVMELIAQGDASLAALAQEWRQLLFPHATDEQFADGYSQAVSFGLLIARAFSIPLSEGIEPAAIKLRKSNSLISTALSRLTHSEETKKSLSTSLSTMLRVYDAVSWAKIGKDKDAWLNFYEDFLEVYDSALRQRTGSYYTPPQVVSAMVRLVDEALRGPLFERSRGLASPDVTVCDPAVGTGTFLLGVMRRIARTVEADEGAGAISPALQAAMNRLSGFELQFGPFAVAQLRIIAEWRALAAVNQHDGDLIKNIRLYITDTLDNPFVEDEQFSVMLAPVAESRRAANRVKREQPITVVIGNPPYKNQANGLGGWIESGSKGRDTPLSLWAPPTRQSAHAHHLRNLYIYFWRWATLKVFGSGWHAATGATETDRHGLICFISASGFLSGPGFQTMREELRRDASTIWVIDCSPEGHQPEVATRIFQGVQQPICIVMVARAAGKPRNKPAAVYCMTLPKAHRDEKFKILSNLSLDGPQWQAGLSGWGDPFLPEPRAEWANFAPLKNAFAYACPGVTAHRIWPIAPDAETLLQRWNKLRTTQDLNRKADQFQADRDRNVTRIVRVDLGPHIVRSVCVAEDKGDVMPPQRYAYRSFDRQWIIPDHRLLSMARPTLWGLHSSAQIYITAIEDRAPTIGPTITICSLIPDLHHYNGRGGRVYPLWGDAKATMSNIRTEVLHLLAQTYGEAVIPEDVFAYIAGVMAHSAFTKRFAEDLIQPGLRLPLTADVKLFKQASELGREVIWLHSYGERCVDAAAARPKGPPRLPKHKAPFMPAKGAIPPAPAPLPDTIEHDPARNRLMVGTGYIENVTKEMWDYEVSGKQIIRNWFSYRKRDRSRPIIGDRRPPSPLEGIQPTSWPAEYTSDLIDLLNVVGRLIEAEPAQAQVLDEICTGPLIPLSALQAAGIVEAPAQSDDE